MSGRKVAVTGLGVLSPIGNNVPDSWAAVCAGKNGIGLITLFDASDLHFRIAGEVRGFEDMDALSAKQKKAMGRFAQLGVVAGIQAIADAGLGDSEKDAARIGISVGSGIGGLPEIEATTIKAHNDKRPNAPPRVSPFLIPSVIINIISGHLSIMYNFTGPGVSLVSACTTGAHNIGNAFRMISYGDADVMVCGGAEAVLPLWPLAVLAPPKRFPAVTTHLKLPHAPLTENETALCWEKAPGFWCWKNIDVPVAEAPKYTP